MKSIAKGQGDEPPALVGGGDLGFPHQQLDTTQQKPRRSTVAFAGASGAVDVRMEKRAQKFLLFIIVFHFICWLPLNVLK